jgi:hypothetical protein
MHDALNNGTTFFLDCGKGPFGVTAGHVYDAHAEIVAKGDRCQIGRRHFDLRERLIARGRRVDIATFKVSPEEIAGTRVQVRAEGQWPHPVPKVGAVVAFAGFPGVAREIESPGRLVFGNFSGMLLVDDVGERMITCVVAREYMVEIPGRQVPPPGYNPGGMSGAPMFHIQRGPLLWSWRLAGVIAEGGSALGGDVVRAVRADFINADGTLNE